MSGDDARRMYLDELNEANQAYAGEPHISLQVGEIADKSSITGLVDTGAGATLGFLDYHEKIAQQYPHLVQEFTLFDEDDYYEEPIGGVDANDGPAVLITAAIVYLFPFRVNGGRASITIALSSDLATNTIFGLPFLIMTKMMINLGNDSLYSPVFAEKYDITYMAPTRTEKPALQSGSRHVALLSRAGDDELDPAEKNAGGS